MNVKVQVKDEIRTSAPPIAGTAGDPVLHGGVVRIRSARGGFDQRFNLPNYNWGYLGSASDSRGFIYRARSADGAIRAVVVKDGKLSKIKGNGLALPNALASDPDPLEVNLIIGNQRYCMGFGGDTDFDAARSYVAKNAPAPGACPP